MKTPVYFFAPLCALAAALAACSGGAGSGPPIPHLGSNPPTAGSAPTPASVSPIAAYNFGFGMYEQNVERVCPDPMTLPRGQKTCLALLRIDLGGGNKSAYHGADFARAAADFKRRSEAAATPNPITNTGTNAPYGPAALQAAYNLPSSVAGAGQTVAVVDQYDDPYAESDLAVYRSNFNLPPCTTANGCFRKMNETGAPAPLPSPDPGWSGEISLDLDMVSAVCPNCKIVLVEATQNFDTAENTAVASGAKYISNSFGGPESLPADPAFDSHPGVVITASSGDSAYTGIGGAFEPAALANVIGVGGTSLYPDPTNARGWTEVAWHGSSSGCSELVSRPAYQSDEGCSQTKFDGKSVADISAVADPYTGVWVYESYPAFGWVAYGGTSVASPIVAAAYALAGNAGTIGVGATSIWKAAGSSALNDVMAGQTAQTGCTPTLMCIVGPGYDGPTGWGTPNGLGAL